MASSACNIWQLLGVPDYPNHPCCPSADKGMPAQGLQCGTPPNEVNLSHLNAQGTWSNHMDPWVWARPLGISSSASFCYRGGTQGQRGGVNWEGHLGQLVALPHRWGFLGLSQTIVSKCKSKRELQHKYVKRQLLKYFWKCEIMAIYVLLYSQVKFQDLQVG